MARQIFRQEALDRLASPDRLDQLMPLTSARGWIALAAAGLLALIALLWAIFGSIAVTASADGVFTRGPAGVFSLTAPEDCTLTSLKVQPEQTVEKGQILAELVPIRGGKTIQLTSPINGRVLVVQGREGDKMSKDTEVLKVESPDRPLEAILFVPVADVSRIKVDDDVRVWSGQDGLRGKVKSASRFPIGHAQLSQILQSEEWATSMTRLGPVAEVAVTFGDPIAERDFYSGTPCRAEIVVARQRPISMILPAGGH